MRSLNRRKSNVKWKFSLVNKLKMSGLFAKIRCTLGSMVEHAPPKAEHITNLFNKYGWIQNTSS